jgi:glycerol-3-phosphate dehydrogenase
MIETQVLVIGGGATGTAVARDAALRGMEVVLVERRDLAEGTTGRFHGLLHSGGRYVVKDPISAKECMDERVILGHIAGNSVEDTGGLFVSAPGDGEAYCDEFVEGCHTAGIPVEEISVAEALRREPLLHPGTQRAFTVPDATIDGWRMVWGCAHDVERRGGSVLTYHEVEDLVVESDRVIGAKVRDTRTGEATEIRAEVTVSASGAWAGKLAAMAGCEVHVSGGRGIMIAMNHRLVQAVINRCRLPSDSDILVPIRTVSVLGTTDSPVEDPDDTSIPAAEIPQMIADGAEMVPHLADARALRVWAGVRPLYSPKATASEDTRDITRNFALLDHRDHDSIEGFLTITGGKLTTARLMAEKTVDAVAERLGVDTPCTTAEAALPGSEDRKTLHVSDRLARREENLHSQQAICECELVTRGMLLEAQANRPTNNLDDLRRTLRLGMGPCQGGFCIPRAAAALVAADRMDASTANRAIESFVEERWKGVWPLLAGRQARQARLDEWLTDGLLDVRHLPQ